MEFIVEIGYHLEKSAEFIFKTFPIRKNSRILFLLLTSIKQNLRNLLLQSWAKLQK